MLLFSLQVVDRNQQRAHFLRKCLITATSTCGVGDGALLNAGDLGTGLGGDGLGVHLQKLGHCIMGTTTQHQVEKENKYVSDINLGCGGRWTNKSDGRPTYDRTWAS